MYVCEWDMCWMDFCNFSLITKKCEEYVKLAPFSNERHFKIWFPKKENKLSELYKKDPILHVTTTFFLKQGDLKQEQAVDPFHNR